MATPTQPSSWAHWFDSVITPEEVMYVVLIVLVISCIRYLWKQNKNSHSTIDFKDLICVNGKLTERKISRFGAWIVSTWGFVYLIVDNRLTEWYFVGYMGAWVANALLGKMIKDPNNEENFGPAPKIPVVYPRVPITRPNTNLTDPR